MSSGLLKLLQVAINPYFSTLASEVWGVSAQSGTELMVERFAL